MRRRGGAFCNLAVYVDSEYLTLEVAGLRANVTAWSVGSIWVTPEQVLGTPV